VNPILQSLASEEWAYVVKALLHTLWLGGLAASGLYFVLRGKTNPVTRYRWCVGVLLGVVLGGIAAWAVLQRQTAAGHPSGAGVLSAVEVRNRPAVASFPMDLAPMMPGPMAGTRPRRWTLWLALVWLGGAAAMLARAGSLVVEAEKLRRGSSPLENEAVLKLIEEARRKLGLVRRIQVVVTGQLTSPAVMGWWAPVLILPISMVTTMPMDQLQLILLHELAHIRRGDYLVNLCQLLVESLLFFNPAVWWISRQIRQEREACCDAVAIALAGERLQYARTLAQVAGAALAAAPAFGDGSNPSGLKDRIQRLLVPGYRPALRLTWCALLVAFFVGGGLLLLSALGTRAAVAAILTPQQRIERIEKKMTELGEKPVVEDNAHRDQETVSVSVHLRTADGSPLPDRRNVLIHSSERNGSGIYPTQVAKDGRATKKVRAGRIWVEAEVEGFAPAVAGPFDGMVTNQIDAGEIILDRGFEVSLQLSDTDSGAAITNAALHTQFVLRNGGHYLQNPKDVKSDAAGRVRLPLCIDQPFIVTVNAPGYAIIDQRFERLSSRQTLEVKLNPGANITGRVVDRSTGEAIANAALRVIYEKGQTESRYQWTDAMRLLARTDADGRFTVNQLRRGTKYWLGASAPGHESVIFNSAAVGAKDVSIRLGAELVVRGHVNGKLDGLQQIDDDRCLYKSSSEVIDSYSWWDGSWVPLHVTNGVVTFQFTNRVAGPVTLGGGGYREEREVNAPIVDWVVNLNEAQNTEVKVVPKREVVFRFRHPSGVPPRGTVFVTIPDNLDKSHLTAHAVELAITNGEVRSKIIIGGRTSVEPKRMAGYWFNAAGERGSLSSIEVTNGAGPMVIEIPLVPAGAIYAQARNADGTPAGDLFFGLSELKRAPGRGDSGSLDGGDAISDGGPRKWVSGPLPLGGTYQIHAWRGNLFCVSKPIKLTEANPDAEVELQFPAGKTFDGVVLDADGKPLRDAELKTSFRLPDEHAFGLKSVFTDGLGRFQIENTTPEFGVYSVEANAPGLMAQIVKLDFGSQPQTIRLKRGQTLGGRVVQAVTGYAIPNAEVRALNYDRKDLPMLTTRTDANGRFEFTMLGDVSYTFYVAEGQLGSDKKFRADGNTNVVLTVNLYEWSKVKPKAP
jgi:beta-lactamase regulating signal transducer with metallopeptidase domain/uncharacterized GH25 family protein